MNAVVGTSLKQPTWKTIALFVLGLWLSGSFILDFVIMPTLGTAGMLRDISFASAGYSIFWMFNRIEVLCAALVLTSLLALRGTSNLYHHVRRWSILLSGLLLAIALINTYIMTPQMSALAMQLNLFEPVTGMPSGMVEMHEGYWFLEAIKLIVGATVLGWCYHDSPEIV